MKKNVLSFSIFALMILMLASCASSKKVAYFQNAVDGVVKRSEGLYDATNIKCDIGEGVKSAENKMDKTREFEITLPKESPTQGKQYVISCGDVQKVTITVLPKP